MSACPLTHLDGAYVLGALAPAERAVFEDHLATCASCSEAVAELAGVPGLLARVDEETVAGLDAGLDDGPDEPPALPGSVLTGVLGRVEAEAALASRRRRRRARVLPAVAAAAALVVVGVGGALVAGGRDGSSQGSPSSASSPSTPSSALAVEQALAPATARTPPMRASVGLTAVPWGTRVDLTCDYPAQSPRRERAEQRPGYHRASYALLVRTREGRSETIATWRDPEAPTMHLVGATAAAPDDIAAVRVVRRGHGTVLRLDRPTT